MAGRWVRCDTWSGDRHCPATEGGQVLQDHQQAEGPCQRMEHTRLWIQVHCQLLCLEYYNVFQWHTYGWRYVHLNDWTLMFLLLEIHVNNHFSIIHFVASATDDVLTRGKYPNLYTSLLTIHDPSCRSWLNGCLDSLQSNIWRSHRPPNSPTVFSSSRAASTESSSPIWCGGFRFVLLSGSLSLVHFCSTLLKTMRVHDTCLLGLL